MEVAGLVVGVIPLAVAALQCYEETQSFASKIRRKSALVRSLGRALGGYDAVLTVNIDWLLRSVGCYCDDHEAPDWTALLEQPDLAAKARRLLGDAVAKAFHEAILESCDAIETILKKIEGFLAAGPKDKNDYHDKMKILKSIKFGSSDEVKVRYRQGFKLALSSREIEECIAKVDKATNILNSIRSAKSDMQWIESRDVKKGPLKKIVRSLTRVRDYASQLHQAISSCWAHGQCSSDHKVNLHLQDRLESDAAEGSVQFGVLFMSTLSTPKSFYWRQSFIQVHRPEVDGATVDELEQKLRRVKFQVTTSSELVAAPQPGIELSNICLEVCNGQKHQDILHLCIEPSSTKQYQIRKLDYSETSLTTEAEVIALEDLLHLSNSPHSRVRLYPRACTELALILASGVLQLSQTHWFVEFWTKEKIYFTKDAPIPSTNLRSQDIDITKPLVTKSFSRAPEGARNASIPSHTAPKKVLLEFAILLLELWHSQTIEERFIDRLYQVQGDYLDRKHLAERWIEEDRDLLGFQFDVVTNCLKHLNVAGPQNEEPKWEDETFLQSFAAGVMEPLLRESNKTKR